MTCKTCKNCENWDPKSKDVDGNPFHEMECVVDATLVLPEDGSYTCEQFEQEKQVTNEKEPTE